MANSKVNNKANTYAANMNLSSGSKKAPKLPQALQNVIPDTSYSGNMSKLPTSPFVQSSVKSPIDALKTPSYLNSGAVIGMGGGSVGRVTNEGVIVGGGAINTTFQPPTGGKTLVSGDLSYGKNILKNQLSSGVQAPVRTPAAPTNTPTAQQPAQAEQSTSKIDSYEEFLEKQKDTYKETLDKTNQLLEEQKQAALQNAETARQRSIADSRSSYEQNKATYGANAEALAAMGLSGSGYSDYVNSQAYAQQRADTQNANAVAEVARMTAESEANQGKISAETSYAESISQTDAALAKYKQEQADKKDSYYANLLDLANKGNYTKEQLEQLGKQYGLSEEQLSMLQSAADKQTENKSSAYYAELLNYANSGAYTAEQLKQLGSDYGLNAAQIQSLTDAATTYKNNKQAEKYNQLLNSSDTSGFDAIKSARDNGEITSEQYNKLVTSYQSYYYDLYSQSVDSDFTMVNTGDIDSAYSKGYITKSQYDKLKDKYNKGLVNAITSASVFYANGSQLDEKTAQAAMDELNGTGWLTDENKKKLQSLFDDAYKDDDGCFAKGTLITVADGTQTPVENLKEGDNVLVFNHTTGNIDVAPISYIFHDGHKEYEVLTLRFGDVTSVDVLFEHGFFDTDSKRYVLINAENAKEYIGHRFYHVAYANGAYEKKIVTLTDYSVHSVETECYSVLTAVHINHIANGMLAVTDDIKGIYNIFDLDDDYKYDAAKMAADIEQYGLFTFDEWSDYATAEQFAAFNGAYLKVAIGKGLVTVNEIMGYIEKFLQA